jgi:hypothetical protein
MEADMELDHPATPSLQAIFHGAKSFGLADDEVWRAFDEALSEAALPECLDELSADLARRILGKVRRVAREEERSPVAVRGGA